ncbi:Pyruvate/Phosphoenolpyruvate kinase-like domain-containing protein [Lentinula raphanica]|uniref:Pyruvate/Phosphoenolpyruvate kinase-like domain-containing protein n=1 Tax=Lentinula raphanica TaxID=153919 RepID=A0AA38UGR8_9AGAR|nr:Pyruvate/Phosphoenolpyruvate kinase-like domain-containing protein [Lentinula raphanica]KAJ3972465.1 Pyruvate/Phosphoenolpyruvate kinase-like domain-containing protein [Lentinula raphanica]
MSSSLEPLPSNTETSLGLRKVMSDARKLHRPVVGSWLMFPGASLARMMAQMGYDFVLVDCEHGNIADADMHASVGAIAAQGVSPIVRIPAPENWIVKRTLDTGAHGILCPMMSTAEEARRLVSYAKFPIPHAQKTPDSISGIRGVGSPFAPAAFSQAMDEYIATANRNTFIAVQIETVEGLENCEDIAKVDGIDMLFVGPNDLCSFMGYPALEHSKIPEVQAAIERVLRASKAAGKYAGMFCTSAEQVQARFEQGFDFMNLGADVVALAMWNSNELEKLKHIRT